MVNPVNSDDSESMESGEITWKYVISPKTVESQVTSSGWIDLKKWLGMDKAAGRIAADADLQFFKELTAKVVSLSEALVYHKLPWERDGLQETIQQMCGTYLTETAIHEYVTMFQYLVKMISQRMLSRIVETKDASQGVAVNRSRLRDGCWQNGK